MNGDNLKRLYDNVSKEYELPDFETFKNDMQNEENLKKFYSSVSANYELPSYDEFVLDMGLKKKEGTTSVSKTPTTPSAPSGEEAKIKELTVKATELAAKGDTENLEIVKAELQQFKDVLAAKPKEEVDVRAIDTTLPTEERITPTIERVTPSEKIYRRVAPTANTPLNIGELQLREKQLKDDIARKESMAAKMGETLPITSSVEQENILAGIEDTYKQLERDYLIYLQAAKPDTFSNYTDRILTIEDKKKQGVELSLGDQEFALQLRDEAINARLASDKQAIEEIKGQVDLDTFNRKMELLNQEVVNIQNEQGKYLNADGKPKSPMAEKGLQSLDSRLESISQTIAQIQEETGVTPEITKELQDRYKSLVELDLGNTQRRKSTSELEEVEATNQRMAALKNDLATNGNFAEKGGVLLYDFFTTIGSGTVKALEVPKVLGDLVGAGDEYGWTDTLYDLSYDLNKRREGAMSSPEDASTLYKLGEIFSRGAGNVVQFATGSGIAKATATKMASLAGAAALSKQALDLSGKAGTVATSFLMSEGDNYREALKAGISTQDAAIYSTMISLVQGVAETVVPDSKYFDASARKSILDAIKNGKGVKEAVEEYFVGIVKSGVKEAGEEVLSQTAEDTTKELINSLTQSAIYQDTFNLKNYKEAALSGFIVGGGMTALRRGNKSPIEKETQRAIAENADVILPEIAEVSPETMAEVAADVETLVKINKGLQSIPAYTILGPVEQDEVVDLLMTKDRLKKAMSEAGIQDETTKKEIEVIDAQANALLSGKKVGEEIELEAKEGEVAEKVVIGEKESQGNLQSELEGLQNELEKAQNEDYLAYNRLEEFRLSDEDYEKLSRKEKKQYLEEQGKAIDASELASQKVKDIQEAIFSKKFDLEKQVTPTARFNTPQLELQKPKNPFDENLLKLGYKQEDIDKMSIEQKQEIAINKTEAPVVESSAKVDAVKENKKQERLAEMQAELDAETTTSTEVVEELPKSDIEFKKTEIERQRQDELNWRDKINKAKNGKELKSLIKELFGRDNSDMGMGFQSTIVVNDQLEKAKEYAIKDLEDIEKYYNNAVNRKYDAELKALEGTTEITQSSEQISSMEVVDVVEETPVGEVTETVTPVSTPSVESPVFNEKNGTINPLQDVETTTKALEQLDVEEINGIALVGNETSISEAYHEAKVNNTNPELVQAVESVLNAQPTTQPTTEVVSEVTSTEQPTLEVGMEQPTMQVEGAEQPVVKEKVAPKKSSTSAERKAEAKAKVNEIAEKLKEKLRNKGIEGFDVEKFGIGQDDIIDAAAEWINKLIDVGYTVSDAINEFLDSAKDVLNKEELKDLESALNEKYNTEVLDSVKEQYPEVEGEVIEAYITEGLKTSPQEAVKKGAEIFQDANNPKARNIRAKGVIRALKSAEGLDDKTKDKLNSELGAFYYTLSDEEATELGQAFIDELGGLDAALEYVNDTKNNVPPLLRVFVLGQGIIETNKAYKEAKTQAEKDAALDKQIKISDLLDEYVRSLGRATSFLRVIYFDSPLSGVRRTKKEIDERNQAFAPQANKNINTVFNTIDSEKENIEALDDLFSNSSELLKQTIEQQQKKIDGLQTELDKLKKGSKGKPKKSRTKRVFTREGLSKALADARGNSNITLFGYSPKAVKALGYAAGYALEEGYYKFKDFYEFLSKTLKKEGFELDTDDYVTLYNQAVENAVDNGEKAEQYDTALGVDEYVAKIAELEAEIAAEKRNLDIKKKVAAFGRLMSEPINKATNKKTKEQNLREKATELDNEYGTDAYTKQVEAYLEGKRQDKILTPSQLLKVVEKGLIEAGYSKEKDGVQKVDWSKIVKGEKNVEKAWDKVEKALQDLVDNGALSQNDLNLQLPLLRDMFFANVNDRKAKAVVAEVNKFRRRGKNLNRSRRKSKAERLVELYNLDALTKDEIREALAEELNITIFTTEEERYLEDLLKRINEAPTGFEKEILEEELYYILDKKKALHTMRRVFERARGALLTGLITQLKNFTGIYTATNMTLYQWMLSQMSSLGKGGIDTNILKISAKAQALALNTMGDVFFRGGVDMGSAFSDTTGTKEGQARIRYSEQSKNTPLFEGIAFLKNSVLLNRTNQWLHGAEKRAFRLLPTMDAYSSVNLSEVSTYNFIKGQIKKAEPNITNKELLAKTWEVMYGYSIDEALEEARKEFEARDIDLGENWLDNIRVKRRAYEIIQQKRGEAAVKAGQLYSNRYTFKATDAGVGFGVMLILMGVKKGMALPFDFTAQRISKSSPKASIRIKNIGYVLNELIFTSTLPFIKGITNILEKGLELTPYGLAKGVAYTIVAARNGNSSFEYNYARAGEYYYRAIVGTAIAILAYYMADDEDEDTKKIYATGSKDYRDNRVESTIQTNQSITIKGRKVPTQAFGTLEVPFKMMGIMEDIKREKKRISSLDLAERENASLEMSKRFIETILADEYLKGLNNLYKGIVDPKAKYWNNTFAEYITRVALPASGMSRQFMDMNTKEAKKPITFTEHLMKQSGVFGGWLLDRKAFDYRGRTYDMGDRYGNSSRAFVKMTERAKDVDTVDQFVYKYQPNLLENSINSSKLDVMEKDGTIRSMSDLEYYDYTKDKAELFNELLLAYYQTSPEDMKISKMDMPKRESDGYTELFKEAVSQLVSEGEKVDLTSDFGVDVIESRMQSIHEKNALPKEIRKKLNEINRVAQDYAIYRFSKRNGFVQIIGEEAEEEYNEILDELE